MAVEILKTLDPGTLGRRLQQAREARGLTRGAAARQIEEEPSALVAIESGERRIRPSELVRLAGAYGRATGELLRGDEPFEEFAAQVRAAFRPTSLADSRLGDADEPPLTVHYQYLAARAYLRGEITEGQFARFVGVDRLEARRIVQDLQQRGVVADEGNLGEPGA